MDFDALTAYRIPYWHPLAVHFPLVLLLLAAGAAAAYAAVGTAVWRVAALVLLGLGAVGAWAAGQTGEALEAAVEGEPMAERFLDAHEQAAGWTAWAAAAGAVAFAGATATRRRWQNPGQRAGREPLALRLVLFLLALAPALLVAYTAHLGGLMVWGVSV